MLSPFQETLCEKDFLQNTAYIVRLQTSCFIITASYHTQVARHGKPSIKTPESEGSGRFFPTLTDQASTPLQRRLLLLQRRGFHVDVILPRKSPMSYGTARYLDNHFLKNTNAIN